VSGVDEQLIETPATTSVAPLSTAVPAEDPLVKMRAGQASLGTELATVEVLVSKSGSG
jgi:hypothetical protein